MKVLAFDIATNTGCAVGDTSGVPTCWSVDIGKGKSDAHRFSNVLKFTQDCIEKFQPDVVAVECAIGGKNTSHFLVGVLACVIGQTEFNKVKSVRFTASSIRKHFLGYNPTRKGTFPNLSHYQASKAIKNIVIARCNSLGWHIPEGDHDAADAAALWDMACSNLSVEHQMTSIGGLFHEPKP